MLEKRWLVTPAAPPEHLKQYNMHPIVAQTLYNRGFTDPQTAYAFLTAEGGRTFEPLRMTDMPKAVARVRQAIRDGECICVYGDFDADGATSTALMITVLKKLGANAFQYIPDRVDEGYGLNIDALRTIYKRGGRLVITVDCGIRAVPEVAQARQHLDIIITDHHSLGPELPPAYAVVNPKQDQPPIERMLAGVGVAYMFAAALVTSCNSERRNSPLRQAAAQIDLEPLLDLVALGTVADLVPLNVTENRLLVRRGLRVLNRAERPGVQALLEVAGIAPGQVTAMDIAFGLGPRINAAGRLESALTAVDLLCTRDEQQAKQLSARLQDLNQKRRDLTEQAQEIAQAELGDQDDPALIFAAHADFQHGIVGLVAGRLTEQFYRPAVVMRLGEHESNASCRSIPQFDITGALDECADLLVRHGGHAQAAGLTVANENIPALRERLTDIAADQLAGQDLRPTLRIDAEVNTHHLTEDLVNELNMLEPTGSENPAPLLVTHDALVQDYRAVGRDDKHLKLALARPGGQAPIDAIGFNLGHWAGKLPERVDVAYRLEINEWNGRRSVQMNLQDIRPATTNGQ